MEAWKDGMLGDRTWLEAILLSVQFFPCSPYGWNNSETHATQCEWRKRLKSS